MKNPPKRPTAASDQKITDLDIRSALLRSGYLIEYRTEALLRKRGWYVAANSAYEDQETKKSREIDIYALLHRRVGSDGHDRLFSSLLIECINNPQPVAFFAKKPVMREWGVDDIKGVFDPEEVIVKGTAVNVGKLLKMASYHHYCRGDIATQFCSFNYKTDKKEWMAWHDETHFNAFSSLVKAVEHRFRGFQIVPGNYISWEFMYPVLLVQGNLLTVRLGKTLTFKNVDHVKFRRTMIWNGEEQSYIIDVVTERAFAEFVAMMEAELERTASGVQKHIRALREALNKEYEKTEKGKEQAPSIADKEGKFGALASGVTSVTRVADANGKSESSST